MAIFNSHNLVFMKIYQNLIFTCLIAVSYGDDKKNPENYVRIEVDIKGLEKSLISKTASNAEIKLDVKDGYSIPWFNSYAFCASI
jgi:hypothetical protein